MAERPRLPDRKIITDFSLGTLEKIIFSFYSLTSVEQRTADSGSTRIDRSGQKSIGRLKFSLFIDRYRNAHKVMLHNMELRLHNT